jgi:hypothetical protein
MSLAAKLAALQAQVSYLAEEIRKQEDGPRDQFRKFDQDKRLVYAEVYLPDVEDAHGHSMTATEVEKMAHGFMLNMRNSQIDVNHDNNVGYDCCMVESFIAQEGDPTYMPGAWVGVVKVNNDEVWRMIKDGELTGFSFEGMGYLVEE